MVKVKTHRDHPASMEERISRRLRDSGDVANADSVVQKGSSPNRTISHHHLSGHQAQHGPDAKGEGSIDKRLRGSNNTTGEI